MTITEADYRLLLCSFVQFQFLLQRTSGFIISVQTLTPQFLDVEWLYQNLSLIVHAPCSSHLAGSPVLLSPSDIAHLSTIKTHITQDSCHQFCTDLFTDSDCYDVIWRQIDVRSGHAWCHGMGALGEVDDEADHAHHTDDEEHQDDATGLQQSSL